MSKEIGSEFWLETLPINASAETPEWLKKYGDVVLTSSGRGAITLLLQQAQPERKTVLLPAYICESVILPFLEQGYVCYFYDINTDFTANLESIVAQQDVGVFLHMGYFGFSTNCNLADIVRSFKAMSTIIIEDVTHTIFSDFQRFEENDYYIGSLRKWMGLPSGGFVASKKPIDIRLKTNTLFADIRREALIIKAKYMYTDDQLLKKQYLDLFTAGENILENEVTPYAIDTLSINIINTLDAKLDMKKRRANFKILSQGLRGIKHIEPIFDILYEDICPFFYPLYIKDKRNEMRQKLIEHHVYCPIHWPVPKQIRYRYFKNVANIYNTILSIPCDQRYETNDMERVISVLNGFHAYK